MVISPITHGIRGYAAVFGNLDQHGTIIDLGAFLKVVGFGPSPQFGRQHSLVRDLSGQAMPAGVVTAMWEDDTGLYFEARIHDTPLGNELLTCVSDGSMTGVSFAFDDPDGYEDDDGVLHLDRLRVIELGPVAYPSNRLARCEVYDLTESTPAEETEVRQLTAAAAWVAREMSK